MMEDRELTGIIQSAISNAQYGSSEFEDREDAIRYYQGKPRGDEVEGRSAAISRDIADMLEAVVAATAPSFETDTLIEVVPGHESQEKQTALESKFINYIFKYWNNGYLQIQEALRDALLFRNAVAKIYKEETVKSKLIKFDTPITELEIYQAQQQYPQSNVQVLNENTISVETVNTKLVYEAIPVEEFLFTSQWNKPCLDDCPFTCHHRLVYKRELVELGFDAEAVKLLPSTNYASDGTGDINNLRQEETSADAETWLAERVDFYECYLPLDYDGTIQMYRVNFAEGNILDDPVPVEYHPFAAGTCILMPHRFVGISLYDQLKDIQDNKTRALRNYYDNIFNNNNRRMEVDITKVVDINDVVESRPGGVVRSKSIGSVVPIPVDDIGPSIQSLLNYLDKIRTDRSGATLDMQTENVPIGENRTAHGVERLVSSKEMIAAAQARVFAETYIRSCAEKIYQVLTNEFDEELRIKFNGEWLSTNPYREWSGENRVNICVLPSTGEKMRKANGLASVINYQMTAIDKGQFGILLSYENIYSAIVEYTRLMDVDDATRFWLNPSSKQSQQALVAQQKQQQAIAAEQTKVQKVMLHNQVLQTRILEQREQAKSQIEAMRAQLENMRNAAEAASKDANLQFDYTKLFADLAMQLTNLEAQYNKQISDYQENKGQVSGRENDTRD